GGAAGKAAATRRDRPLRRVTDHRRGPCLAGTPPAIHGL
ncbi:MAG: hypothetical protein AVDCRST_MAG19-3536, partial [uncultured Thermomicrobiales bacterium]